MLEVGDFVRCVVAGDGFVKDALYAVGHVSSNFKSLILYKPGDGKLVEVPADRFVLSCSLDKRKTRA